MGSSSCNKKLWWLLLPIVVLVIVVVVVVSIFVQTRDNTTNPEVTISQGTLRGVNMVTHYNREIYAFKGIPFAEPPIGNLRFAAPVAPSAWDGTWDASSDTSDCPQLGGTENEDCLYLNVFTPKLPTSEDATLLPVMMYIYGGGFKWGSNDAEEFGPEYLLDKDVVLIVPTYRLGILGFFSTGDEVVPGNNGLKDVVRALEWSRDNIAHFGGDANQTTIFGQSAGGMITHLLALSKLTDGLFQRYISQSGTALSYDGYRPPAVLADRAIRVGEYLNCSTDTSTELVNCLRGADVASLLNTDSLFTVWSNFPNAIWSPTAEPDIEGAFITDDPANLVNAGEIRQMEFLASVDREEGIGHSERFYDDPEAFEEFLNNIHVALPPWLTYDTRVENVTAYTDALVSYYLNDLTADRDILLSNFTQLMTDALCGYPSYRALQGQLAFLEKPQFLDSFEYRGVLSFASAVSDIYVAHGDENIYLFPLSESFPDGSGSERSEADWEMVDTMVQLWTSFAINGTPTSGNAVSWEQYSTLDNYLRIGNYSDYSIALERGFATERMQFWDELTAATTWL